MKIVINILKALFSVNYLPIHVLVLGFLLAYKLAIYPDEIAVRILVERFFISGGYKISLTPYCSEGFSLPIIFLMKFPAIFWSFISHISSTYLIYRVIPSVFLVGSLIVLFFQVRSLEYKKSFWFLLLFMQGVSIFSFVALRPESFFAFYLSLLLVVILRLEMKEKISRFETLNYLFLITFFYILILYLHPKSLLLIFPSLLVFFFLIQNFLKNFYLLIFGFFFLVLLFLSSFEAFYLHKLSFVSCNAFPDIEAVMRAQGIDFSDLFHKPINFVKSLRSSVGFDALKKAFINANLRKSYDITFLPPTPVNFFTIFLWLANYTVLICTIVFVIAKFKSALFNAYKSKYVSRLTAFFFVIFCYFIIMIISDTTKSWYNINLQIYILGMLAFLCTRLNRDYKATRHVSATLKLENFILKILPVTILLGLCLTFKYFYIPFSKGYEGPSIPIDFNMRAFNSFSEINFKKNYEDLNRPIIIDDLTYHAFYKHKIIYPVTYLNLFSGSQKVDERTRKESVPSVFIGRPNPIGITRCGYMMPNAVLISKAHFVSKNYSADICEWYLNFN